MLAQIIGAITNIAGAWNIIPKTAGDYTDLLADRNVQSRDPKEL
jgi:hypothetical protein